MVRGDTNHGVLFHIISLVRVPTHRKGSEPCLLPVLIVPEVLFSERNRLLGVSFRKKLIITLFITLIGLTVNPSKTQGFIHRFRIGYTRDPAIFFVNDQPN